MKRLQDHDLGKGAENVTTLVSVSLLLLIAGIAVCLGIAGRNEERRLRESLEMTLVMADSVSDAAAASLAAVLAQKPYVAQASAITRDEALKNWQQATGDDLKSVYGVNPLTPEISLRLKGEYASPQQMHTLARGLEGLDGVEGVAMPQLQFVDGMNRTLTRIIWCLAVLCAGLVAISFVLINNMVHLGIYSRRFAIRTMQLVGATDTFVRRPFLLRHAGIGLGAGLIAAVLLAAGLIAARPLLGIDIQAAIPYGALALTAVALVAAGVMMCTAAAWYATGRHLKATTDALFD